jgi:GrpB-like predicted nucleotidyltransferase (UPF0157 family)
MKSDPKMPDQKRYTLTKDVAAVLEEYKKEKREELLIEGVTDDTGLVKKLVLTALNDWLKEHPDIRDKYLLK